MRHASISDAFNAAANLTQQVLQPLTREREYELETELYQQSLKLSQLQNELINDYTRIDPAGNIFQQNPEKYQEHVDARLLEWKGDAENAVKKVGKYSRYYQERLDRLYAQGNIAMGQRYKAATVEVEKERVNVATGRTLNAIDNTDMDPITALDQKLQILGEHNNVNPQSITDNQKNKMTAFTTEFGRTVLVDVTKLPPNDNGIVSVAEGRKQLEAQVRQFEDTAQGWLKEGETVDQYIQDKIKTLENARTTTAYAIRKENFDRAKTVHDEYQLAKQRFQESGSAADAQRVLTLQQAGEAWRNTVRESERDNFNDADLSQMVGWYQLPHQLTEAGQAAVKTSKGNKPTQGEIEGLLQRLVNETLQGTSLNSEGKVKTLYDLKDSEAEAVWKLLSDEQKAYFENDSLEFEKTYFKSAFNKLQEYINNHYKNNPGAIYAVENIKSLFADIGDKSYLNVLIAFMNDLVYSVQHDTYTEKEFRDKAAKVKGLVKAGKINGFGNPKASNKNSMAATAAALLANQEAVFTDTDGNVRFLSDQIERDITGYAEEEHALLSKALGIAPKQLSRSWRAEEGQQHDVMGLGEYNVLDEKENLTVVHVRISSEPTKDRKPWQLWVPEHRLVYEYREGRDGEWKPFNPEQSPPAISAGREQQQVQQRLDDHAELTRIAEHGAPRPASIDQETWATSSIEFQMGVMQNLLKKLENPNPEKIPPDQWKALTPEQQREKIFAYFRGDL